MTDYRQQQARSHAAIEGAFNAPTNDTTTTVSLSTSSAAAGSLTKGSVYRLWADVNCFVVFTDGGSTAADTDDMPLTGELPEWFVMKGVDRIAAIVASGTGTLYITKLG
jgi:hypothetical protein